MSFLFWCVSWDPFAFSVFTILLDVDLVFLNGDRQTLSCVLDFELLMDGVLGGNGFSFDLLSLRCPTVSSVGSVQDRSAVNIFDNYAKERSAGESLEDQSNESGTIGISCCCRHFQVPAAGRRKGRLTALWS